MTCSPLASHSRFAQRIHRRYASELALLGAGTPTVQHLQPCYDRLVQQGHNMAVALRILRQLVIERVLSLDCAQQLTLAEVTQCMTDLAEFALNHALTQALAELDARHGAPVKANGLRAHLWIVGMGKLGARELNVSSDIDLIYVYDEDGETAGDAKGCARISNHEYFGKAVRSVYALVGDNTEHGFVFRVDLALRPHGNSGPPALSLDALEDYLHVQGREWERFAWLKSRVVAPTADVADRSTLALRQVVMPFVYRRYLDYSVFDALRSLHQHVRNHANQRSAGRPQRANDVKLSRGGIREIEFIVQLLQVVRGGQFPELRSRPTLSALPRLVKAGLMSTATADSLADAYTFLRQLEHRIQYLDDMQTHVLPTNEADLTWIAQTMGFTHSQELLTQLEAHRDKVAQEFDTLLGGTKPGTEVASNQSATLDELLPLLPALMGEKLQHWLNQPKVQALRDEALVRLSHLLAHSLQWFLEDMTTEVALLRLLDWLESLLRRESYLALLQERPTVHQRLLRLLGAAKWPARYLQLHPGVIDELAGDDLLLERFDANTFESELEHRRVSLKSTGEDDDESLLNLLRRAHHAEVFRTLARDVEGQLSVEQVADDLSALADAILRVTTRWCWSRLAKAHEEQPHLCIIAYGKLGGKELGYGSDLDLVFVYDDDDERAHEAYGALVRKLINWLTVKTGEGDLYEIDTALRPNGNAGLLITSFASYANYQQQRGSNTAWTWEHQAITRARCVLGDSTLQQSFEAVRHAVITAARDPDLLRTEIVAMRTRLAQAHPVKGHQFDIKYSPGGMIDAEFAMQFLVLSQASQYPSLSANKGNIALLEQAEILGLLPAGIGHQAASAYRTMRQIQHKARLNEEPVRLSPDALASTREAILQLWKTVFAS